ncbi:hypothetical protein JCM14036_12370 [Desulfotomaculum defluvii]
MTDHFQQLRNKLANNGTLEGVTFTEGIYLRLIDTLQNGKQAGPRDLAVLIRNILRQEAENQGGVHQTIRVPKGNPWPTETIWHEAGCRVLAGDAKTLTIEAQAWKPRWLPLTLEYPPDQRVFAQTYCRNFKSVTGDPFLREMERTHYRCAGQREAVRAVLAAPLGATLLVNLPTGAGKSLCAHLPGLLFGKEGGLTVIVVPTTALCIDQERALSKLINHPTAYYGGTTAQEQERNACIRERIRNGTQQIVFTSPEGLLQSLSSPVYQAAERGELRMLVVDEAHMIDQWGDQFRPAFQVLAGMRKKMLQMAGEQSFLTLLLSATVTESCLDTLQTLFGDPGPFEMVSAVQLRPEPSYWFARCQDEVEREQRVLEALHHLPRPLILYVSEVAHANAWIKKLRAVGYSRCEVMTGSTVSAERLRIVHQWRDAKIDIMVATSAFGLGVDQADVRAVIHACVPENLDRYYQEVGRGGRDGRACLSLVLYTATDLYTAQGLNHKKIITIEKGLPRWQRMFAEKKSLADGTYQVPIDVTPGMGAEFIDMENHYNEAWNVRVLTLMSRAGLIELSGEQHSNSTEAEEPRKARVVKILHERHLDQDTWQQHIEASRQKSNRLTRKSLKLMEELLAGQHCVGKILAEMYSIESRPSGKGVRVSASCGGCPACRQAGQAPYAGAVPTTRVDWPYVPSVGPELSRLLGTNRVLAIFYPPNPMLAPRERRRWKSIMRWFFSQGLRNWVAPSDWQERLGDVLHKDGQYIFAFEKFEPLIMPKLPTLVLWPEEPINRQLFTSQIFQQRNIPRVILLPNTTRDPDKEHCLYKDTLSCKKYLLEEFCTEVGL